MCCVSVYALILGLEKSKVKVVCYFFYHYSRIFVSKYILILRITREYIVLFFSLFLFMSLFLFLFSVFIPI